MSIQTQAVRARCGEISPEMRQVAEREFRNPEFIRDEVAAGRVVIPANPSHQGIEPIGIGRSLRVKINANIGNSSVSSCPNQEVEKLRAALAHGADTVMDLSTGANIPGIRAAIIAASPAPLGTVPIYEIIARVEKIEDMDEELILEVIAEQAAQGVDYMTIHAGLLAKHVPLAVKRLTRIVSRGGSLIAKWMRHHGRENPFFTRFDDILAICARHDVTLSLGDGLRPGCLADASDEAQFAELDTLGELTKRCRQAGVQVMIEGPGHVPINQIEMNMRREREVCDDAPFYVLGPVVADCAPGYDHVTSAIGGAIAAFHGASMLCYVTPKEHLGLPNAEDVRQGVVVHKLAAHAADVALGKPRARERDDAISAARMDFDWEKQFELALDPERAREFRAAALAEQNSGTDDLAAADSAADERFCTMCGPKFCAMRVSQELEN